jgi:plastocyanin
VHAAALEVALLGAEKSKVPFYIAGGVLALWAVVVSVVLGLRKPRFPGGLPGERIVITISIALVVAAVSTAVLTSGTPEVTAGAQAAATQTTGAPPPASQPTSTAQAPSAAAPESSAPRAPAGATSLKLAANPSGLLAFDTKQLRARAGKLSIAFTNQAPLPHNLTIAAGGKVLSATPTFQGGSKTLTANLKPGTYTFYCSVPGHRQAGMEGTLHIEAR